MLPSRHWQDNKIIKATDDVVGAAEAAAVTVWYRYSVIKGVEETLGRRANEDTAADVRRRRRRRRSAQIRLMVVS